MKSYLFAVFFLCSLFVCPAQIRFEDGYFIENSGHKVSCLIRNVDWKNNPLQFHYRLSPEGEVKTAGIDNVREFAIAGQIKYVRSEVNIDRRDYLPRNLTQEREPAFNREQLFLKLLVEGKGSLYKYEDGNLVRYFFSVDGGEPQQLVYVRYKDPDNNILENNQYKSQLWSMLRCDTMTSAGIGKTSYTEGFFEDYFSRYNDCHGSSQQIYGGKGNNHHFNLTLRPGLDFSSMKILSRNSGSALVDFDKEISLRMGLEMELFLPFNKNKWALTFEPFYRTFKSETEDGSSADYQSVVASVGVRHYFYLDNTSRVFLGGNYGMDFPMNSGFSVERSFSDVDLEINQSILDNYWSLGLGYNWNEKIGMELRYCFNQDLLVGYDAWKSEYHGFSLILGYSIL